MDVYIQTHQILYIKYVQVLFINYTLIKLVFKNKKQNEQHQQFTGSQLTLSGGCPWDPKWGRKKSKDLDLQEGANPRTGYLKAVSLATECLGGLRPVISLSQPIFLLYQMNHTGWPLLALRFWCSSGLQIVNLCLKKRISTSFINKTKLRNDNI